MLIIVVFILIFLYYRGFWLLNKFKDTSISCAEKTTYLQKEMEFFILEQKQRKYLENEKNKITKIFKKKLFDFDSKLTHQITQLRVTNIYKKYLLINQLNNNLIKQTIVLLKQMIAEDYNTCLAIVLKLLLKKHNKK